jgi:hypothetical protein
VYKALQDLQDLKAYKGFRVRLELRAFKELSELKVLKGS